ncbi:MAG TPA: glycosyltransferase family 1 protein [Edaphobacter sp.]|uniref:glycosyltransferase family 4 protein n=1 Tax=Edaphobacter sp. TaxID=1934404 RepID=UPI002C3E8718|nr:glycosyltransferase family 1 protein [Edaphobacter sp.]HUZ96370.1 glycosyltransferase family 1 protein [Edaphobacter sp.]
MNVVIAAMSAPTHMNGVSRHAANLARALLSTKAISEIHFVAGAWQKEMFRGALGVCDPRLHSHWIPLREANLSRLFWYYRELPCIAAQLEADIVHLTFPAPTAVAAYPCATVLSLHDLYPFDIPCNFGRLKSAVARHTIFQCVRRVDAIACVSSVTQMEFARRFPTLTHKTQVIHNVVEFRVPASISGRLETLKGYRFILCVAQHRSNKNIPLAIRVFERLLGKRILPAETRLVVVGIPGPETRNIEEEIRNARLSRKVLLFSGLSDAEMRWCYENCLILLAPSSMEGFGLPVAEAILAGARVVCSDIPAFREVGGEACHYVPWTHDPVEIYVGAIRDALGATPYRCVLSLQLAAASIGERYASFYGDVACATFARRERFREPVRVGSGPAGIPWK